MVQADNEDPHSLKAALSGANIVFGNTAYPSGEAMKPGMQHEAYKLEFQQGKNLADAASTIESLELFVWSLCLLPRNGVEESTKRFGISTQRPMWLSTSTILILNWQKECPSYRWGCSWTTGRAVRRLCRGIRSVSQEICDSTTNNFDRHRTMSCACEFLVMEIRQFPSQSHKTLGNMY